MNVTANYRHALIFYISWNSRLPRESYCRMINLTAVDINDEEVWLGSFLYITSFVIL